MIIKIEFQLPDQVTHIDQDQNLENWKKGMEKKGPKSTANMIMAEGERSNMLETNLTIIHQVLYLRCLLNQQDFYKLESMSHYKSGVQGQHICYFESYYS